jgi:hypothetical protein
VDLRTLRHADERDRNFAVPETRQRFAPSVPFFASWRHTRDSTHNPGLVTGRLVGSDHARTARQQRRTHRYGELGELLGMSARNVTVLVDGLEKEQRVRPVPHERDRRATYIEITEKGKGVAAAILAPVLSATLPLPG